ncbi:MAG: hypothetical protein U0996_17440 [Planctomycetaceae bacterium]
MSFISKLFRSFAQSRLQNRLNRAYEQHREELHRNYFLVASSSGLPRGLTWKGCEWPGGFVMLREQGTGEISRLSSVNLTFEAIEGGDMEHVKAVSTVREACAVFQWDGRRWVPTGRTLFNMDPTIAAQRFGDGYEVLQAGK